MKSTEKSVILTASQTVGPYLHIGMKPVQPLLGKNVAGERITIRGHVLDGKGDPVPDGVLETWQANSRGKYAHPDDWQDKQTTHGFSGFGRMYTEGDGGFRIRTIRPGAVPWNNDPTTGAAGPQQAPHIVVSFFARGLLKHVFTRIYFEDDPQTNADPLLQRIKEPARRKTLLARKLRAGSYEWNIVLQGKDETVFFDI